MLGLKERKTELCGNVVPERYRQLPAKPFCAHNGDSIQGSKTSPTGYKRSKNCPLTEVTSEFCQITDKSTYELYTKKQLG